MSSFLRSSRRSGSTPEEWISLPASSDVLHAIGGGHSFESALADIIDNSIDARASHIRIRFIVEDSRLMAVQIRDDGTGMAESTLIEAFRLGGRREYSSNDLGHFGIGLKAASMRHAACLRVYSAVNSDTGLEISAASLDPADSPDGSLGVRVLSKRRAESGYSAGYETELAQSGTVVEWTNIRSASDSSSAELRQEWLDSRVESTRTYLGLVFHRKLEAGDVRIEIDVLDVSALQAGPPRRIDPVNPFGYQQSGHPEYPKILESNLPDGTPIRIAAHLLPPKGIDRGLLGKREDWQGLYIYRNDRLLTARAGWQGVANAKSELRLARAAIDISDELLRFVTPSPEKNGVVLHPEYSNYLQKATATASGSTFADYLDDARHTWKVASKRTTEKPITELSDGLPAALLQQLSESFGWRNGHAPARIAWDRLDEGKVFDVDLDRRMLRMNSTYAEMLGGEDSPQANAVTMLLYLLIESNFTRSSHLRATTIEHLEHIDSALVAAIRTGIETINIEAFQDASPLFAEVGEGLLESSFFDLDIKNISEAWSPPESPALDPPLPVFEQTPHIAARKTSRSRISGPLTAIDIRAFEEYCTGAGIAEVAAALGVDKAAVVTSLALAFFGIEAVDDDASLAPFHGYPYTPEERERIISAYHSGNGQTVIEIARNNGRTPFAIAWLLLDSPKRPVHIDRRARKNIRRRQVD